MAPFFLHLTGSLLFSLLSSFLLSISLLLLQVPFLSSSFFLISPQLFLPPSVSVSLFVNFLFITLPSSFLFSPPVSCQVSGLVEVGVSDSCWSLYEAEILPALSSAVCSAMWQGWRGHDMLCGDMFLMLLCHSQWRKQHPQWRPPSLYILLQPTFSAPVTALHQT